ncbi:hypothetical protein L218DRAFT_758414 [Marasmius fiardii PR-910]|nr:hypothetical protein L218DRAFT_758414 [Marasmius fiardii PR-910]
MNLQLQRLETLSKEDFDFFKEQLGTDDEAEIKAHIVEVASKAIEIYHYGCIATFAFSKTATGIYDLIGSSSAYQRAVKLCSQHEDALFLELGAFFGTTLRKAVTDGIPVSRVIGSDIHSELWNLGHELFKSTPTTFPAAFVEGDAFDPNFISGRGPCTDGSPADHDLPDLRSLTSLVPLQGRVSAIHVANVFHLFIEEKQVELALAISSLLSPRPGSLIFGVQFGFETPGLYHYRSTRYIHSPESWKKVWQSVFPEGSVKIEAKMAPMPDGMEVFGFDGGVLVWSCTVL